MAAVSIEQILRQSQQIVRKATHDICKPLEARLFFAERRVRSDDQPELSAPSCQIVIDGSVVQHIVIAAQPQGATRGSEWRLAVRRLNDFHADCFGNCGSGRGSRPVSQAPREGRFAARLRSCIASSARVVRYILRWSRSSRCSGGRGGPATCFFGRASQTRRRRGVKRRIRVG